MHFSLASTGRRTLQGVALALLVLAVIGTALPAAGAQDAGANTTTTPNASETNGTSGTAPAPGEAIPASCQEIRDNPTGQGPDYRVVRGACAIELTDGEVLSNVWFKASGERIDIWARGSGWTIRNVAITNHGAPDEPPLNLRVTARDGVGLVHNVWASDIDNNVLFVHASHRGTIRFDQVTFLRVGEDGAYASRPGNPKRVAPVRGGGGIVGFNQAFVKKTGTGPKAGYGLRLGSDGSYITNATILSTTGPAVANTFAGGNHPNRHTGASGVLLRNVDIVTDDIGIRLNNHQDGIAPRRRWTSITTFQNVQIDAGQPIQKNEAGGVDPIIRGSYGTNPTTAPPPGAPRSPVRAASGIGGGTGSIGGPVAGPGGGFVAVITQLGAILALGVVGLVLAVLVVAVALLAWLERGGSGGGGGPGFP
jgi:hypothetical protein